MTVLEGDRWFRAQGPAFAVAFLVLVTAGGTVASMSMEQIPIAPHSPLANRSTVEASVRRRLGVIVFGIQWEDSRMELNPQPDTAILLCDKRVALRRPESLRRVDLDDAEGVR